MSMDWIIHYVSNRSNRDCSDCSDCSNPGYYSYPGFANVHTHGLENHGQRELCLVLDIGFNRAGSFLNAMGTQVAKKETKFTEGIRTDLLENGMEVELISFDGDPTLYIMLPDKNGHLPGDEKCETPYSLQRLYARLISKHENYI